MCHVLVIEDDFLISEHIVRLAEEAGATSVCQVDTQDGAILAARDRKPQIILSDVKLFAGTGPLAVQVIVEEHGAIPVIFITGTPEACHPCDASSVILGKPILDAAVKDAFMRLAPPAC